MGLGKKIAKKLIELEPDQAGWYDQLGGIYAMVGDWEGVSAIRKEMRDSNSIQGSSRVWKVPRRSVINLNEKTFEFIANYMLISSRACTTVLESFESNSSEQHSLVPFLIRNTRFLLYKFTFSSKSWHS